MSSDLRLQVAMMHDFTLSGRCIEGMLCILLYLTSKNILLHMKKLSPLKTFIWSDSAF